MPCNYYGKIIPGDRAGCIAGGGTWVSEPSLMSDPTTGQGIPMTGINPIWDEPLQGGGKYGDPTDAILTGAMFAPGIGPAARGVKLATPAIKRTADKAADLLFKKKYNISKGTGKTPKGEPIPLMQGSKQKLDKRGRPMFQKGTDIDPMKVTGITGGTALAAKSIFDGDVSPNPYGVDGPVTDRKVVQTPKEGKTNVFNGGTDTEPTGAEVQAIAKGKDIPKNIWDKMQTKDYWLTGMEGGSGGWDNRLYRLGEMMAYMGTPLSKRGDSPSKRWQAASMKNKELGASANKAAQAALDKQLKDAAYKWSFKEITDVASDKFDAWFGTDVPMFGKDKEQEKKRFLSDLTEAKRVSGTTKTLQSLIDSLLLKGDYK